ncbi:MAG: long-chain-acyl-CoA synthetase [Chitinophagales bacterium]|nr:long-chain-acyl-CoA synthetase [Chitinophagales bacterium]
MSEFDSLKESVQHTLKMIPSIAKQLPTKIPNLLFGGISALTLKDDDKNSIGLVLEENAVKHKDRAAIYFEDKIYTHSQLNQIVNQYAHLMIHHGVKKGQVVIVFLENRPEVVFIVAACAKIGAIASLINSNQRSQVLLHSINQKNDGYFFVGEELVKPFEDVLPDIVSPRKKILFGVEDNEKTPFDNQYYPLKDNLDRFPKSNIRGVKKITSDTPFAFIFTSGTTGMPKAAVQVNRKWLSCMYWFGIVNLDMKENDVIYVSIPFYHSNALLIAWSSSAVSGGAMAVRRKFSASNFWSDCIKYKATAFIYIGDILRYLYNTPPSSLDKKHQVKKIIGNGLRPDIWQEFKERFGIEQVYEFYASSEGNMTFTNTFNLDNTVGWCATNFEIVEYNRELGEPIYGEDGYFKKVKPGEVGLMIFEITEKYPFPGYVGKKETNRKVFYNVFKHGDQWFNTGDIMRRMGMMHAQFVDRDGDTFRWKGENVSTAEVEQVINTYPGIDSATVYGVSIPNTDGKAGMVAIKMEKGVEMDWNQFSKFVSKELPFYAVPLFARLVENFEYTATYKVIKNNLKEDGFDKVKDSVWFKTNKKDSYQVMSKEVLQNIQKNGL